MIIGIVAALLVLIPIVLMFGLGLFLVNEDDKAGGTPSPTATETATESSEPKMYGPEDRPSYEKLISDLDYKIANYKHLLKTGEVYEKVDGKVDEAYVNAFIFTLVDYRGALRFGAIGSSYNPLELDDRIYGWQHEVDALEQKFLKAEDLGVSWTITDSSGETKTYEGKPAHDPTDTDDTATVDDPFAFATNYPEELDENGTYITAGEEIAAAFGISVIHGVAELGNYCPNAIDYGDVLGLYCSATPDIVWIPSDVEDGYYPEQYAELRYIDTIKHEIAHDLIMETCNTTSPPIAGARYEGLTNSYAVLHLGASKERLQPSDPANVYYMSDETHEWARQVFNGNCG